MAEESTKGYHQVDIANLGGGAAKELFDMELAKVLVNIADPNTDEDAVREISLTVKIKPTGDKAVIAVICKSKLAPIKGIATQVHLVERGGKLRAYENDFSEADLFPKEKNLKSLPATSEANE